MNHRRDAGDIILIREKGPSCVFFCSCSRERDVLLTKGNMLMNATRKSPPSRQVFLLTIGAMIGAAGFAVLVVILHLLPSTYNPLSHYVSDYAHDSYGYLMQMAFALLGVGVLSLVGAYYLGIPRSARPQAAMILLIVFGLSR